MTRRRAVLTMIAATLLWSIAGVVTRRLDTAHGFEATFWRSAVNAAALVLLLSAFGGGAARLAGTLRRGGAPLWISGLCWCTMYTAFMVALTLTSVADVLVTMALAPLFTALLARLVLGQALAPRTWMAIAGAGIGIAWMYGRQLGGGDARQWLGTAVALAVPVAAAVNWTLLQQRRQQRVPARQDDDDDGSSLLAAVLLGALLSAALTLPLAWPLAATAHDLGLLALLGVVQLAIPCLLAVRAARVLQAAEIALLSLLEVLFGVVWAWLGAGERPDAAVLGGGLLVLASLAANEALGFRVRT